MSMQGNLVARRIPSYNQEFNKLEQGRGITSE